MPILKPTHATLQGALLGPGSQRLPWEEGGESAPAVAECTPQDITTTVTPSGDVEYECGVYLQDGGELVITEGNSVYMKRA